MDETAVGTAPPMTVYVETFVGKRICLETFRTRKFFNCSLQMHYNPLVVQKLCIDSSLTG